jgi:malate dehydrogenase
MKLGIIGGAGLLGSTTAFVLGCRDVLEEIKLVDLNANAAKNQAMDMGQAILPFSKTKITAAEYSDLDDCEVLLVTANMSTRQVTDRSERLKDNMGLLGPITDQIKAYCRHEPILIICTNPVDVFTYVGWKLMGCSRSKVIGFSSNDTMRLKWAVSEVKGVDYRSLACTCIGEHGDNQVRLLDQMTCDGKPLSLTAAETETVIRMTKDWFKEFSGLGIKRSTGWTSGVNLAEMIEAIASDSKKLLPCSAVFGGEFGYSDVACGALCRLGRGGVEEITLPLNPQQKAEMDGAVAKIKEQISTVHI